MPNEELQLAKMLLELKAKSSKGLPWNEDERGAIKLCFEKRGGIGVLAACCILSSERPKGCSTALDIVREAIEGEEPPPYVELSIYEALIYVEPDHLVPFYDAILRFIERSLMKRAVNLDNTIYLLGKLARPGDVRALALLRTLAHDSEPGIRDNASLVLRGVGDH